ncbi:hypothetical protein E1295_31835 [Nonomuraea mesophila]|uniref:Uncharacterized protein n=1 Tax=Nonomuraea mesophila TaxID=2530382 RepID=A0A4R5EZR3_9ACTN|nr:hypothetical protein [Nonomuraea mesophila]TDE40492.1 hypothetical protein E1295_31835 [Nonomuraea mesophila]
MPDILTGARVKAADFPAAVWAQDTTDINGVSSGAFTPGSPEVGVTFTAPTSGRVLVFVGGGARAAGGPRVFLAANVFEGVDDTGPEVLASSVGFTGCGFSSASTDYYFQGRAFHLDGLSPGATHYARVTYATSGAGSGDISCREIGVVPIP